MKKVIILMIVCAFLFAGCAPLQDSPVPLDTVVAKAQVVDMKNGLLVIGLDDYLQGLCSVGIGDTELPADITPGDEIAITFDGMVAESYPCQISNVTDIKIIQKKPDAIGVYREAFLELRNTDTALDSDATSVAIDMTQIHNLSEEEKRALEYLISCDIDMFGNVYQSTFDELEEQGYITSDDGFKTFEEGVLYEISSEDATDGFVFEIGKFRSSIGALVMSECMATLENGEYSWQVGGLAMA